MTAPRYHHKYLVYSSQASDPDELRQVARYVLNRYLNANFSAKRLNKMATISFNWNHPKLGTQAGSLRFDQICEQLKSQSEIDTKLFNLPDLKSLLFDSSIEINLPQPLLSRDGKNEGVKIALPLELGDPSPLAPSIIKEGLAINDMLLHVFANIVSLHSTLIESSQYSISTQGSWLLNFRMLLNECVSAIDMHLHKIYLLAQYRGAELGLKFEPDVLGDRFRRRVMDKFAWIGAVKGKHLDNAQHEMESFRTLKDLRNHLNHFDPPCFCYSVEEMRDWLNLVPDVGRLIWKIREKFDDQLNPPLIKIILLPKVEFRPLPGRETRPSNETGDTGYASSIWK